MVILDHSGVEVLIVKIREASGFDFSGYARPSLMRRVQSYLERHNLRLPELIERMEPGGMVAYNLIQDLTVNYSEMFRDPDFFDIVRSEIFPYLESFASVRLWVAGCASGEEAFSLSIFLKEAGLLEKSIIYATDLSEKILHLAREGVFSLSGMRGFSERYFLAGGLHSLSNYYDVSYGQAIIAPEIRKNIVFSLHDLTGDGVFNEFQFVSCRNVMIYFTLEQRIKVFRLLYDSLAMFGFLCLGKRETLRHSGLEEHFRIISMPLNIYQRVS